MTSERRIYAGTDFRASVGLDGGCTGTWTIRAGWRAGGGRRPLGTCEDTFAVWCKGDRLLVAVGAAGSQHGEQASAAGSHDAQEGVGYLVEYSDSLPNPTAKQLIFALDRALNQASPNAAVSYAVGVFPQVIAPDQIAGASLASASLAALGSDVGAWCLTENGTPTTLLAPGRPTLRVLEHATILDGYVVCLGTSALTRSDDGGHFTPLWAHCPDEPDFLRYLETATHGAADDAALVAMWSGRYLVSHPQ